MLNAQFALHSGIVLGLHAAHFRKMHTEVYVICLDIRMTLTHLNRV